MPTVDETPFAALSSFVRLARVEALALAPAGDRLVATVSRADDDESEFVSSLWELDVNARRPARRLTRSARGESGAAFLPDGCLLLVSRRPRPAPTSGADGSGDGDDQPALWVLPRGGEPWVAAAPPGGVVRAATSRRSNTVAVVARSAPGHPSADEDRQWWSARRRRKVTAVLHQMLPVRHWDHHLGPDELHVYATTVDAAAETAGPLVDLTPDAGPALHDANPAITPDGQTVVVDWMVPMEHGRYRYDLLAIDTATGARRTLAADDDYVYRSPQISPDGRLVVALRTSRPTPTEPPWTDLWVVDVDTGTGRAVALDDGPTVVAATFNSDGSELIVTADWCGRRPLLSVDVASGKSSMLTDGGSWSSPLAAPDGCSVFALRSAIDRPPHPVRVELSGEQATLPIDAPGAGARVPGSLEEVTTKALDGTDLRAWLVLPDGGEDGAAPLALWVHGGPVASWNDWHWRWNPWLLAARGWAVLLPDPALSTGYGMDMVRRGWGQWGGAPYDDVMALTDAAVLHPRVDPGRVAMMGGSYGGYMANWMAGHTDRFAAIVSHASLWSLEQFQATTDSPADWADEWGYPDTSPELYRRWSPDAYADAITTPMLIIHGERDYRCPVGESLRLWSDLVRRGVECQFLWFADENHWVLKPGDVTVWYETVFAFLDRHVLGQPWERPPLV
jgi:dipeptidyl aminopeptidase/acylaminoacyl peptidase